MKRSNNSFQDKLKKSLYNLEVMKLIKVVTSSEMARVEAKSLHEGGDAAEYMRKAGIQLASALEHYIAEKQLKNPILLLCGRGNNGGDAYCMGEILAKAKYQVKAYALFEDDKVSELNLLYKKRCIKAGIEVVSLADIGQFQMGDGDIIVDGLLGTGFHGEIEGLMAGVIEKVNERKNPVFAIDIPSGLNGNDGSIAKLAMQASLTVSLGQPKMGLFINKGFDYVGEVSHVDFGMDLKFVEEMEIAAELLDSTSLREDFPKRRRSCHKYEAGYVLGFSGSPHMPGAAILSTLAAMRSGAGIVRLYSAKGTFCPSLAPEVIHCHWDLHHLDSIKEEMKRARSIYMGPGMGKGEDERQLVHFVLREAKCPIILDADALSLLEYADLKSAARPVIMTPHRKEALRLMGVPQGNLDDRELFIRIHNFVNYHRVIFLLKGAPTFIFRPQHAPIISVRGSPGMATAGSGDVLTGILAALLAAGQDPLIAACFGTNFHGISGEIAAAEKTAMSMIASDMITALPDAYGTIK